MKKLIYIFLLLEVSSSLYSQTFERFKSDFSKIDTNTFDEDSLNYLFRIYYEELTPYNYMFLQSYESTKKRVTKYPFASLLHDSIYNNKIGFFFNSDITRFREFSYYLISAIGDKRYEKRMLERLTSENEEIPYNLSTTLMHLETDRTSVLFDFLVLDRDNSNERMISYYSRLNKDSLRNTAYNHIDDADEKARNLSYTFLSVTDLNEKTEKLLKRAFLKNENFTQNILLAAIKNLQIGNLKDLLVPLLDHWLVGRAAMQALANSSTESDRQVIVDIIESRDTLDNNLLYSLLTSKNIENNKLWLKVIQTEKVPNDFFFHLLSHDVYLSDDLLPYVQEAIENIDNPQKLSTIIPILGNREDEKSLKLVFDAMRHEDLKVRKNATYSLQGNKSKSIKEQVESIILDSNIRTTAIVRLAIEHNLNSYHSIFENQFKYNEDLYWRRSSIQYLSIFPLERHISLFKSILLDSKGDRYAKYRAAIGLGNLNDSSSIDLIIEACDEVSKGRDYNAMSFMKALGKLKGDKAKAHLLLHKDSDENEVRELVESILKEWDD
jgi:HEAT repeat protein